MGVARFDEAETLDLIYRAAIEPHLWAQVIEALADQVGATSAALTCFDLTTSLGPVITARSDPAALRDYNNYYYTVNPLNKVSDPARARRNWQSVVLTDEDWIPREEFLRTEYYNDFLARLDRRSVMFVRLLLADGSPCVINLFRPERWGRFEAEDLALARHLHRHLVRAFELCRKLEAERSVSEGAAAFFDRSLHAVFLLAEDGRILRLNPAGEAMLAAGGPLGVRKGRLAAHPPAAARRLEALIAAAAARGPVAATGGAMALPAAGLARPLSVTVSPAREEELGVFGRARHVLVLVTDPQSAPGTSASQLAELFGFTSAESKVAARVAIGEDGPQIAEALSISHHTVRRHLKSMFAKADVRRQSELALVIERAAPPA